MGLFRKRRDAEAAATGRTDPIAALQQAQEALAKTHFATDDSGRYHPLGNDLKEELTARLAQAQESLEHGAAGTGASFGPAAPPGPGAAGASGWTGAPGPLTDPAGERISNLERLAKLHADGVLTDEEFAQQKRQILAEG